MTFGEAPILPIVKVCSICSAALILKRYNATWSQVELRDFRYCERCDPEVPP